MENIIETERLGKVYFRGREKIHALDGVDLCVAEGEFVSVVGPSGSGKTTLLNLLSCLDTATSGILRIKGVDVSRLAENKLVRLRREYMGFVFQQFFLLPTLTAYENVELPLLFSKKRSSAARAKLVLEMVGLQDRANHLPAQLSGGEMQRVAIARALVNEPQIIFADEPTGNLDSATGKEVFHLFKDINQKGITIIAVTHNQALAHTAGRIIHLRDGKI
jgi:putative ABC transport system ATP-binding protein